MCRERTQDVLYGRYIGAGRFLVRIAALRLDAATCIAAYGVGAATSFTSKADRRRLRMNKYI